MSTRQTVKEDQMLDRGELVIRPVSLHSPCEIYLKPFSDIKFHSIYFSFHTGDETKENVCTENRG